ncbi:hypothetical protein SH139x_002613 [Planctomycetaceae bacterium SH139]
MRATHFYFSIAGSLLILLLGTGVAALGMLPSDAADSFLLFGLHLLASGLLGVICSWFELSGPLRYFFCWTSMLANATLVAQITMLVLAGTFRAPLIVAAPLLIGIPAMLNTHAATYVVKSKERKLTSQYPGTPDLDE